MCHSPRKKKRNKNSSPGPLVSLSLSSSPCFARRASRVAAAGQPRATCRPSSTAVSHESSVRPYPLRQRRGLVLHRFPSQTLALSLLHCRRRVPCRRRFAALGEPRANSSHGKLPLALLLQFRRSPGLLVRCAGPPPLIVVVAPPLCCRSSPASLPVSFAIT